VSTADNADNTPDNPVAALLERAATGMREKATAATDRRPIPGYEGYEADNSGEIWSIDSNWRGYGPRVLAKDIARDGYLRVRVYRNGKRIKKQVHVLVALAFHEKPDDGAQVRHLDGNELNNAPTNLAWGSARENAADRERHGRTARGGRNGSVSRPDRLARGQRSGARTHPERVPRGIRQGNSKINDETVREIRALHSGGANFAAIGRRFGLHGSHVRRIVRGQAWAHVS
jgi:hypothetical protein